MGLDAWIFSGKKPDINRIPLKPHTDDLDKLDYQFFIKEDINDLNTIKDLFPICIEKEGISTYIDWERLKKDNHIPLNTRNGGFTRDKNGITQYFYGEENNKQYSATLSNLQFKSYEIDKDVHLYITLLNEIAYFRNEIDLDIDIGNIYNDINYDINSVKRGGYYHLNKEVLHELNNHNQLFANEFLCEDDDSLYYHAW